MYNHVIFDLDGTLLDTLGDLAAAGNYALSAMGFSAHPVHSYRKMVGNGVDKLIFRMLPENQRGESTLKIARGLFDSYYSQHMLDTTAPYPGIMGMLSTLSAAGLRMGVVSNKDDIYVKDIVERYFPNIFFTSIGLREGFLPKPHPASTIFLADIMEAERQRTLYVGDSDVDMLTAKNAGLTACGVSWGFRDVDELQNAGADFVVDSPAQLTDLILGNG